MFYLRNYEPKYVVIIKVDHWFDFKWRQFSHKIFGAMGVWREPLRIPPFNPNRIIEEFHFENTGEEFCRSVVFSHIFQSSSENAQRKIRRDRSIYVWFSGNTAEGNHASLMLYNFPEGTQSSWYASFLKNSDDGNWRIRKTDGISRAELLGFIRDAP